MEPLRPALPSPGFASLPTGGPAERLPDPVEPPTPAVDPAAVEPGKAKTIPLTTEQRAELESQIVDVIAASDEAMEQRKRRWIEISDAYNMRPDPRTQGYMPNPSRLVSEMTRSNVNIATATLVEGLESLDPPMVVEVFDDQKGDPETAELVAIAKELQDFLSTYSETDLQLRSDKGPMIIHRACKLGTCVVRATWQTRKMRHWYRDQQGNFVEAEAREAGRVVLDLVENDQMIVWPMDAELYAHNRTEGLVVGHRSFYTPSQGRLFLKKLKLPESEIDEIITSATGISSPKEGRERDLEGKDIHIASLNPFKGELMLTELFWHDLMLKDWKEPANGHLFFFEPSRKILRLEHNPFVFQRHNYIFFNHWREDRCVWGSGIGHDSLYPQLADSSLWNLYIDNLKLVGNFVRIVRFGSMAEALHDEVGPGYTWVTESPDQDIRLEQLGGSLTEIKDAFQLNDQRAMKLTGQPSTSFGFGDPTLKSGASPSSLAQLIQQASKRSGMADRNLRNGFSELAFLVVELLQQYADSGVFYERKSEEGAALLTRAKYLLPPGDLRSKFRIRAKAPSATANKETLTQHLLVLYQMAGQHIMQLLQVGEQVIGMTNPSGWQILKEKMVVWYHNELFKSLVEIHDVPTMAAKIPVIEDASTAEDVANQAIQKSTELEQQLMQITQQYQQLMSQAQSQQQSQAAGAMVSGGQ